MFENEIAAVQRAFPGSVPLIAIYAATARDAYRFGVKVGVAHTTVEYDKPSQVRGSTLSGAVLLDPPGDKVYVPESLEQALMTAATALKVEWTSLVKIYREGVEVDAFLYEGRRWFCSGCTCVRAVRPCWKCGPEAEGYPPIAGSFDLKLPDVKKIRELAMRMGYCIAEHGSKERDLDLVAVPWVENAVDADELAQYLAENLTTENGPGRVLVSSYKPHGRKAYNIQLNGFYKLIDLSITPKANHDPKD